MKNCKKLEKSGIDKLELNAVTEFQKNLNIWLINQVQVF